MHDFGKLVYLDLQKTGSTFVSSFLNHCCVLPLVKEIKHGRIQGDYDSSAFYFITIRHPVSQYSSLYRYGLDGRGGVFNRFRQAGKDYLYQDNSDVYNDWLRFMLDSSNAAFLKGDYGRVTQDDKHWFRFQQSLTNTIKKVRGQDYFEGSGGYDIGFMSFRFLMLALAFPLKTLSSHKNSTSTFANVSDKIIANHVIKQENLTKGLLELSTELKPELFDQLKVKAFLGGTDPVNTSTKNDVWSSEINEDVLKELNGKESMLLQHYGQ